MKKTVCAALALICLCASVLGLTACESKPEVPVIPDGYQLYDNGAITFAYPADWVKADGSVVILTDETGMGNNITVAHEPVSELYTAMTVETFDTTLRPVYEAMGFSVSDVAVEQLVNESGIAVTKISHTTVMNGGSMFQTMFIRAAGDQNYIVTVTEVTEAPEIAETIFATLFVPTGEEK